MAFFSGGKDSVFAVMKARQNGVPVDYLLFNTHDFPEPNVHQINRRLVEEIARLIGIPLQVLHLEVGREYALLADLFSELDVGVVTVGNINVEDQMEWYEKLCEETGAALYAPLWAGPGGSSFLTLMGQLEAGLKAMICSIMKSALPARLLGRVIDYALAKDLLSLIDPCGEGGEYHTLVLDAPIMSGRLLIDEFSPKESKDRLMLTVERYRVEDKK